jgi:hypothetical protein
MPSSRRTADRPIVDPARIAGEQRIEQGEALGIGMQHDGLGEIEKRARHLERARRGGGEHRLVAEQIGGHVADLPHDLRRGHPRLRQRAGRIAPALEIILVLQGNDAQTQSSSGEP